MYVIYTPFLHFKSFQLTLPYKAQAILRSPGPKGGTLCPLQNVYIYRPIAMKFGTDVKQVMF